VGSTPTSGTTTIHARNRFGRFRVLGRRSGGTVIACPGYQFARERPAMFGFGIVGLIILIIVILWLLGYIG
jgi:hypothetical protein